MNAHQTPQLEHLAPLSVAGGVRLFAVYQGLAR